MGTADPFRMEFLANGLSAMATLFGVAMVLAGVMKLFQIHTTLMEIKDALNAGARPAVVGSPMMAPVMQAPVMSNPASRVTSVPVAPMSTPTQAAPVQAPPETAHLYSMGSGEEMLRALDAQMRAEESQALTPEIVDPR